VWMGGMRRGLEGGAPSLWSAYALLRGRRFVACIEACRAVLAVSPGDPAAVVLLMRAQTGLCAGTGLATELEAVPPGAAFPTAAAAAAAAGGEDGRAPGTAAVGMAVGGGGPGTARGRVPTAQARALGTAAGGRRERLGTSRLGTASFRLGTAAAATDQDVLDPRRLPSAPGLSRIRCDYLLGVAGDARGALALCTEALAEAPADWWWALRAGVCHWHLGMYRDAVHVLEASLQCNAAHPPTYLWLASALAGVGQVGRALALLRMAHDRFPSDARALVGAARLLGGPSGAASPAACHALHARVAEADPRHVAAAAALARHAFESAQPEVALRYYQKLVQQGVAGPELWANLGITCFECSQYDMALGCFARALSGPAPDAVLAQVWYNAGLVAIALGELGLASQCLKLAVHVDADHHAAFVNMGALEHRRGNAGAALSEFKTAASAGAVPEACFGGALLEASAGNLHEANALLALLGPRQERLPAAKDLARSVMGEFHAA